jgi:hypothetical protein
MPGYTYSCTTAVVVLNLLVGTYSLDSHHSCHACHDVEFNFLYSQEIQIPTSESIIRREILRHVLSVQVLPR